MPETITELSNLWAKIKKLLEERIGDQRVSDVFLEKTRIYSFENNVMIVATETDLAAVILTSKYQNIVDQTVKEVVGRPVKVSFAHSESLKKTAPLEKDEPQFFKNVSINPALTFDNFVSGSSNLEAKQAGIFVANNLGKSFNPLFIYSDPGLGKTHLLYAIANEIKDHDPSKRCLYCEANDFIEQYVTYVKDSNSLSAFIKSYDVLLMDDIQYLATKEKTSEFFFNIFNHYLNQGKQVVITSDRHPQDLKGFEERLKSRFVQGLTVSIGQPDVRTCVNIIKSKIDNSPISLEAFDPRVIEFIAEKFSKNIRDIDQALNKLIYYTSYYRPTKYISFETAMEALQSLVNVKDAKAKLSEQRIISTVADYYNLMPSQLTGPSRQADIALARHIAMYLIRVMLDTPFTKIGYLFGGKDHSTVMNGVTKVEKTLKTNTALQQAVNEIKANLKA